MSSNATVLQRSSDLGNNWRIAFFDADGIPLSMISFERIDFGAISFKEIFQNVKTILATPRFSAALERTLGVDQRIVDLPLDAAAEATVAVLEALYFWEPRVEVVDIKFEPDVLAGHLLIKLKLKIRNVIYGTNTPYDRTDIGQTFTQELPMQTPVPGPPGPPGPQGKRGTMWFTGADDPVSTTTMDGFTLQENDLYLNTTSGDVFVFTSATDVLRTASKAWAPVGRKNKK